MILNLTQIFTPPTQRNYPTRGARPLVARASEEAHARAGVRVCVIVRRMSSSEDLLASSRKRRQFIWPRSGFTMIIDPAGYAEAGSDDAPGSATIKTSWRGPLDQMSFPRCWMRRLKACF